MRHLKLLLVCAVVTVAACDEVGAPVPMPLADARANLVAAANGGSAQAFCSDEGRLAFRRAVRTFSAAVDAETPNAPPAMLSDDPAWQMVTLGVMAGVVESSDLHGNATFLLRLMQTPTGVPEVQNARQAFADACPEFVTFYREVAALTRLGLEAEKARTERARERLSRRVERQLELVESASERLDRRLRAAGWSGLNDGPLRRL
jgi:hypothetical protein